MKKLRVGVIGCGRISVMHLVPANYLEEAELVGNRFENPFRQREIWSIGGASSAKERDTESANVLGGSFSSDGNRGAR
jgi:predicted dehydrogenase